MCRFLSKNELREAKGVFAKWVRKVQEELKKEKHIHFSVDPIGSGKRNMVVWQCNRDSFDLDYQITLTKLPKDMELYLSSKAKEINSLFKTLFDKYRPNGFKYCDDSTQALTTLNKEKHYGFDIIITYKDASGLHVLYNKKNTNNANNKDYWWALKSDMANHRENYLKVVNSKHRNELKELYLSKRHKYKDDTGPNKKKSYQILNEAVNEIIKKFNIL